MADQNIGQRNFALEQLQQLSEAEAAQTSQRRGGPDESGLITGPIFRGIRERREERKATEVADIERQVEAGRGQTLFGQLGLEAELDDPRVGAVQRGLMDPGTRAASLAEAQQLQSEFSIGMSPSARSLQIEALAQAQVKTNTDILNAQRNSGVGMSPQLLTSTADMLFDDRQREMRPFNDRLASFDQLMSVIDTETGPATVAVLFKFIKSMDDSVVRTSEGELLTSSVGAIGDIVNQTNKLLGGGIFDENTRQQIKETASALAQQTFATADQISTDHDKRAARFAEQFQTPALFELARGAGFDPGRTFDQGPVAPGGSSGEPVPAELVPEGITPN